MYDDLCLDEILEAARAVNGRPGAFLLEGGDPLGRRDLPGLLTELAQLRPGNLGVSSFGSGITRASVQLLRSLGVQRLQVPFHCARQDAHDWLVGERGALKTAHRAIRACVAADLPVTAEVILTRPTMPHLVETVEVLARLGVRGVCVRRLTAQDTNGAEFVPLSPRLALLEKSLEQAAAAALQRRMRLWLRDLPLCTAPRLRPLFAAPASEAWVMQDGTLRRRAEAGVGCPACPGWPECAGAPLDYVSRFGWEEFGDSTESRVRESVAAQQRPSESQPMSFTWRGPRRVRCEACGDAAPERSDAPPYEPTRIVRARLVHAARYRPSALRLVGADLLAHPQAAPLIYDALRLFRHVEVAGEASAVINWSDLDFRRLKGLRRIDVALYGPDASTHDGHCGIPGAFAAMLRAAERLRQAKVAVGAYAILHDDRWVSAFAEAWDRGVLPGEPRFRLSAAGSSLEKLARCAQALPPGPARSALLALLPRCLCRQHGLTIAGGGSDDRPRQVIRFGRSVPYQPCGSDPDGAFEACAEGIEGCNVPGCPGTAVGWQNTARARQWSRSL